MVLEGSDALKLLAVAFGLAGIMLYLISGIFCNGLDLTCRMQAIGVFLFNSIGGRVFGAFILLVVIVLLLSVRPKAGSEKKASPQ